MNNLYFDADYRTKAFADGIEPVGFRTDIEDMEKLVASQEGIENEPHTLLDIFRKKEEIKSLMK
jgi:hypothetical protein